MSSPARTIFMSAERQMHSRRRRCTFRRMTLRSTLGQARALSRRFGDVALAVALAIVGLLDVLVPDNYHTGSRPVLAVTTFAMTIALAWRRRHPLGVALFISAVLFAQTAFAPTPHPPDSPFLAWMIAVYSVAAHTDFRAAALGGIALLVAVDSWVSLTPNNGGTDLVFISIIMLGFWIAGRVVRSRNVLASALAERTRELEREREERARLAVAQERSRIARELHDVVAHTLGVIVVQAGAERLHLSPDSPAHATFASIEQSGRSALEEMGRLLGMLRTDPEHDALVPQPGLARLDDLLAHIRETGLDVELVVEGTPRALGAGADVSAYRIIQEALTNTVRHSGSRRSRVRLRWGAAALEIEVADDGIGPPTEPTHSGHGLLGIRERVALYGGALVTGRSDLGGYLLVATLADPVS
jgi:signal transduction histidine kinase